MHGKRLSIQAQATFSEIIYIGKIEQVSCLIGVLIFLAVLGGIVGYLMKQYKKLDLETFSGQEEQGGYIAGMGVVTAIMLFTVAGNLASIASYLKPWVAPRAYVLEQLIK